MVSPGARRNTTTPACGATMGSDAARGVGTQRAAGSGGGVPASTPRCCRKASSASASCAANAWSVSASPRSSTVAAKQSSGSGCSANCCCSRCHGRVQASSKGPSPDSVASSTACAPISAASCCAVSACGVRAYRCSTDSASQCRSSTTLQSAASCSSRRFMSCTVVCAGSAAAAPHSASRTSCTLASALLPRRPASAFAAAGARSANPRLKLRPSRRSKRPWWRPSTSCARPAGLA